MPTSSPALVLNWAAAILTDHVMCFGYFRLTSAYQRRREARNLKCALTAWYRGLCRFDTLCLSMRILANWMWNHYVFIFLLVSLHTAMPARPPAPTHPLPPTPLSLPFHWHFVVSDTDEPEWVGAHIHAHEGPDPEGSTCRTESDIGHRNFGDPLAGKWVAFLILDIFFYIQGAMFTISGRPGLLPDRGRTCWKKIWSAKGRLKTVMYHVTKTNSLALACSCSTTLSFWSRESRMTSCERKRDWWFECEAVVMGFPEVGEILVLLCTTIKITQFSIVLVSGQLRYTLNCTINPIFSVLRFEKVVKVQRNRSRKHRNKWG